jgi:hypothetical protein
MLKEHNVLTDDAPADVIERFAARPGKWGPNAMFTGTQDEFMEHIRNIEAGEFMSLEEFENRHEAWKKEYLANRLK